MLLSTRLHCHPEKNIWNEKENQRWSSENSWHLRWGSRGKNLGEKKKNGAMQNKGENFQKKCIVKNSTCQRSKVNVD